MFVLMTVEGVVDRAVARIAQSSPAFRVCRGEAAESLGRSATLGARWSYRVLRAARRRARDRRGLCAWIRHPNYVAVFGEIAGFALIVGARLSGVIVAHRSPSGPSSCVKRIAESRRPNRGPESRVKYT